MKNGKHYKTNKNQGVRLGNAHFINQLNLHTMKVANFFLYAYAGGLCVTLVLGIGYAIYQIISGNIPPIYI